MGVKELEQSSLLLDEKLLRFMEQLELLEEKRAALNSLIEQVNAIRIRMPIKYIYESLNIAHMFINICKDVGLLRSISSSSGNALNYRRNKQAHFSVRAC